MDVSSPLEAKCYPVETEDAWYVLEGNPVNGPVLCAAGGDSQTERRRNAFRIVNALNEATGTDG